MEERVLSAAPPSLQTSCERTQCEQRRSAPSVRLFANGAWEILVDEAVATLPVPVKPRSEAPLSSEHRGEKAAQKVRLGEITRARQCLTGAPLPPGNDNTFNELQRKRPQEVVRELPEHVRAFTPETPLVVKETLLKSLKSSPRGSYFFCCETILTTSQHHHSQQVAEITQHFLHGRNSPVHPRSSVAQQGLSKTTRCCASQQTSPTMEPSRTNTRLKQYWSRPCLGSGKGAQELANFFGPTSSHLRSEDHKAGSAISSRKLRVSSRLVPSCSSQCHSVDAVSLRPRRAITPEGAQALCLWRAGPHQTTEVRRLRPPTGGCRYGH